MTRELMGRYPLLVIAFGLGISNRATAHYGPIQKPLESNGILFMAEWLDMSRLKPGKQLIPEPGPGGIAIDLALGHGPLASSFVQGDIKEKGHGLAFRSTGKIDFKGNQLPLTVNAEFEFQDNLDRHFLVKTSLLLQHKSGTMAIVTNDGKGILLIRWIENQSPPNTKKGEPT